VSDRKKRRVLAYAAGGALLYLLLFPFPMEKETVLAPAWVIDTAAAASPAAPGGQGGEARPFASGGRVGYYDRSGALLFSEPLLYGATTGSTAFINYSRVPGSLVIKDPRGGFVAAIPTGGYPLLDAAGRRVLLVSRDAKGLVEVERSGEPLWRLEFASVITSLDFGPAGVLVGLLDGALSLYDHRGTQQYTLKPAGSRIPVILGCAAGTDALACVAGIDPQRVVVVGRREGRFQPVVDLPLGSDFRREVFMRFAESGAVLFVEQPAGLGLLDLRSRRLHGLPLPGPVRRLAETPLDDLWAVMHAPAASGGDAGLRVYRMPDRPVATAGLPAGADFLAGAPNGFVVGFGSRLVNVEVRHE
jgi:hypothetical protein